MYTYYYFLVCYINIKHKDKHYTHVKYTTGKKNKAKQKGDHILRTDPVIQFEIMQLSNQSITAKPIQMHERSRSV